MIILLNGPPRAGKDTAAKFIKKHLRNTVEMKMSKPLKETVYNMFSIPHEHRKAMEDMKDSPTTMLLGESFRNLQIFFSEEVMKPKFGEDVFGRLFVSQARGSAGEHIVVSDSGFNCEVSPIIEAFGKANIGLWHIKRPDCSFENDSREWIDPKQFKHFQVINNQFDLELYEEMVKRGLQKWGLLD